jgi:hypothetical protein
MVCGITVHGTVIAFNQHLDECLRVGCALAPGPAAPPHHAINANTTAQHKRKASMLDYMVRPPHK